MNNYINIYYIMINIYKKQKLNIEESECDFKSENIIMTGNSAKNNAIINFIYHRPNLYSHIYLYADPNNSIWKYLIEYLGSRITMLYSIPDMRVYNFKEHSLVIYDYDYAQLNHFDNNIKDSFICTKIKHISCIIKIRDMYNLPPIIRYSAQYIVICSETNKRNKKIIRQLLNNNQIDLELLSTSIKNFAISLNNVCTIKIHSDNPLSNNFDIFNN